MASGLGLDILQDSGKFPCAVCRTGVGRSSIRCSKCNLWIHYKKCSGLKTLSEDLSYECPRCRGVPGVRPVDGRPFKEVEVGDCVLEAVDCFCYLGDMLSAGGGCMAAATARCRCAWGKFRENLPLLTSKPVPFDLRGRLFSSNVRSSMLHGTETWPMTSAALHRLCRNDRAMIRWICGVKPSDDPSMDELHAKLGICDLAILVREHRLRWFGHVMRSNGEINRVRSRPVPGSKGPGRPKKTWEECVKQDLKVCGLSETGTQDRLSWRSSVKNSRQEPTPSNGSLPQSMAAPPARRVLGMRTRSFNKTGFDWLIDWHHMATEIWVNIGSGNGLLPDGTKPLPEPMLTDHQWTGDAVAQISALTVDISVRQGRVWVNRLQRMYGSGWWVILRAKSAIVDLRDAAVTARGWCSISLVKPNKDSVTTEIPAACNLWNRTLFFRARDSERYISKVPDDLDGCFPWSGEIRSWFPQYRDMFFICFHICVINEMW